MIEADVVEVIEAVEVEVIGEIEVVELEVIEAAVVAEIEEEAVAVVLLKRSRSSGESFSVSPSISFLSCGLNFLAMLLRRIDRDSNFPFAPLEKVVMNIENSYIGNSTRIESLRNVSLASQFPQRPSYSTQGRRIAVYANYLKLKVSIHHAAGANLGTADWEINFSIPCPRLQHHACSITRRPVASYLANFLAASCKRQKNTCREIPKELVESNPYAVTFLQKPSKSPVSWPYYAAKTREASTLR